MSKKIIFTGCSFTAGDGWDPDDLLKADRDCPNLWTNLVHQSSNKFEKLEPINAGISGGSNTEIFEKTAEMISVHGSDISVLFCQWTAMPRYNFNVGFELWDTRESISLLKKTNDVNLNNNTSWPRAYINDLLDRLRTLHHLHWEILKVVRYSNIIKHLATKLGIGDVFFINGLCPWDKNYFTELHDVKPEQYTPFTKTEIINVDTRDDQDILKLYKLAHQNYQEAGGINERDWINLYDSFLSSRIDINFDKNHPGIKSNQFYSHTIQNRLKELGNI